MKENYYAIIMRAKVINSCTSNKEVIVAVRFLSPTVLVVPKCVISCKGFNCLEVPVVFSVTRNKLIILVKQTIVSAIGHVKVEDDYFMISMTVIHPIFWQVPMIIRFCSDGENHIAAIKKMLAETVFSVHSGFL